MCEGQRPINERLNSEYNVVVTEFVLCLLTPGLELRHSGAQVIYNWGTKNQHQHPVHRWPSSCWPQLAGPWRLFSLLSVKSVSLKPKHFIWNKQKLSEGWSMILASSALPLLTWVIRHHRFLLTSWLCPTIQHQVCCLDVCLFVSWLILGTLFWPCLPQSDVSP